MKLPHCFYYTPSSQRAETLAQLPSPEYLSVYDLEDAVPKSEKDLGRANLVKVFSEPSKYPRAIRVNPLYTEDGLRDLLLIKSFLDKGPQIIILPMVKDAAEGKIVKQMFAQEGVKVYATIETPDSLFKMQDIGREFDGLIFGSGDLAAFLTSEISWENMLYARFTMAAAAAMFNIPAIDTVSFKITDLDLLIEECCRVRNLGFYGKAAPHPSHIKIINEVFQIDSSKELRAQTIISESIKNGGRIFRFENEMIGPPTVKLAEKLIERKFFSLSKKRII